LIASLLFPASGINVTVYFVSTPFKSNGGSQLTMIEEPEPTADLMEAGLPGTIYIHETKVEKAFSIDDGVKILTILQCETIGRGTKRTIPRGCESLDLYTVILIF
jgi:hypothetical protein